MDRITLNGVVYVAEHTVATPGAPEQLKSLIEEVQTALTMHIEHARGLYESMKAQGLSFGAVEAEGSLRSLIELRDALDDDVFPEYTDA